ncbi:MAG TPA: glycosyltransferase family 4 protein [Steroidobacteraceae bacterium]
MKVALVVPGGVDRPGGTLVIPALMSLVGRLAARHELRVFTLYQEPQPSRWSVLGAHVINVGARQRHARAVAAICSEHRRVRFDLVHAIWAGSNGLAGVAAATLLRLPSLVHLAGGELVAIGDIGYGGGLRLRNRVANRWALRRASVVTAASAPMLDAARSLGIEAMRVPLGVDLTAWPPRAPRRRDVNAPARLIHVASLNLVKDQGCLLRAFAQLVAEGRDVEMDIVGVDTLHGSVQALAQELGLSSRVHFHGLLGHVQLRGLFERADLLAMASRHEAGPLVTLEAGVIGVPTVGTSVGHIAEWAPHAALASAVGDPAALAANLARLLDDEDLRLRIAAEAQRRALADDADCTARLFETQYHRVVA